MGGDGRGLRAVERAAFTLPRKASSETGRRPYRKPTQVGWEKTKVDERTLVKELGKLAP